MSEKHLPPLPVDAAEPTGSESAPGPGIGSTVKDTLNAHKGKLAIGVAATLGLMVFYNWRDKKLAKSDPEEYAWLQRLKARLNAGEAATGQETGAAIAPPPSLENKNPGEKDTAG